MTTETKTKTISFSEVSCYQTCSLKHHLKYREKIEFEETDQALILGSTIHSAIETCLMKYQATDRLMNIIELQQTLSGTLRYQARKKKIRYKEDWSLERLERMGNNMLSFWLRSFKRNYSAIKSMTIEKRFTVPLPETDVRVTGIIDAIFHMKTVPRNYYELDEISDRFIGQHSYAIIDWKSYLNKPNTVTLERNVQMAIYAWGALKSGLIPDIKRTNCFLGVLHKKKTPIFQVYPTPVTENLIRQALKILNNTILAIAGC